MPARKAIQVRKTSTCAEHREAADELIYSYREYQAPFFNYDLGPGVPEEHKELRRTVFGDDVDCDPHNLDNKASTQFLGIWIDMKDFPFVPHKCSRAVRYAAVKHGSREHLEWERHRKQFRNPVPMRIENLKARPKHPKGINLTFQTRLTLVASVTIGEGVSPYEYLGPKRRSKATAVQPMTEDFPDKYWVAYSMCVHPSAQNFGLGKLLCDFAYKGAAGRLWIDCPANCEYYFNTLRGYVPLEVARQHGDRRKWIKAQCQSLAKTLPKAIFKTLPKKIGKSVAKNIREPPCCRPRSQKGRGRADDATLPEPGPEFIRMIADPKALWHSPMDYRPLPSLDGSEPDAYVALSD